MSECEHPNAFTIPTKAEYHEQLEICSLVVDFNFPACASSVRREKATILIPGLRYLGERLAACGTDVADRNNIEVAVEGWFNGKGLPSDYELRAMKGFV
jgi:hypothetical protein